MKKWLFLIAMSLMLTACGAKTLTTTGTEHYKSVDYAGTGIPSDLQPLPGVYMAGTKEPMDETIPSFIDPDWEVHEYWNYTQPLKRTFLYKGQPKFQVEITPGICYDMLKLVLTEKDGWIYYWTEKCPLPEQIQT